MVGRALWSVRVLLGEDRRTRRGREVVESSEASLVVIRLLKPRHRERDIRRRNWESPQVSAAGHRLQPSPVTLLHGATVAVDDGGRAGGEPPAGSPLRGSPDAGSCRGLHRATVLCAGHALLRSRPRHELARSRRRGAAPPEARRLARASAARGVHWRS